MSSSFISQTSRSAVPATPLIRVADQRYGVLGVQTARWKEAGQPIPELSASAWLRRVSRWPVNSNDRIAI
jgi:hypothetical protein